MTSIDHRRFAGAAGKIGHTAPSYRRQGLALLVARAFIDHCLEDGLTPNWECWWDNRPSCALAERLGYAAEKDHVAFYWHEDDLVRGYLDNGGMISRERKSPESVPLCLKHMLRSGRFDGFCEKS